MSTPKSGTRPKRRPVDAPHDWLWYFIAGAAIDDIIRAVGLLWRALCVAFAVCVGMFVGLVLCLTLVFHARLRETWWLIGGLRHVPLLGWLLANIPALSLFRSVRFALVLSMWLVWWIAYHFAKAILKNFAPKTYNRIAIQFIRVRNVIVLVLKVVFTRLTWEAEGGIGNALSNALETDDVDTSALRQQRDRATWDLRTIDWDNKDDWKNALLICHKAFTQSWLARGIPNPNGTVPELPNAVEAGGLTARGVYVELRWGGAFSVGPWENSGPAITGLKGFFNLQHDQGDAVSFDHAGLDTNRVRMYLNYTDALPGTIPPPPYAGGN